MQAFTYLSPTEVVFGKDTQCRTADYVSKYGGHRVLIVYGGSSVQKSGLLEQVCRLLEAAGLPYQTFGGAKPNPTLDHAQDGIRAAKEFQADFILAVGGGSAIDTAKSIAIGAANPAVDIWDYWCGNSIPAVALPVGVILTISAAGSETSNSAVLTNLATGSKRGLSSDLNRPKFAIMNPELT